MTLYKLTFFNIRGRAEVTRLIFAVAGVEYEDNRIEMSDWAELKPQTPFGQLPILEFDGVTLCQGNTIARYLARKFNLAGKTDVDQAKTDMIVDCLQDTVSIYPRIVNEKDEATRAEIQKKYAEELLPVYLTNLEKILRENADGEKFFVGDELTWADLSFPQVVWWMEKCSATSDVLASHPKLVALLKKIEADPRVAAWYARRPQGDR